MTVGKHENKAAANKQGEANRVEERRERVELEKKEKYDLRHVDQLAKDYMHIHESKQVTLLHLEELRSRADDYVIDSYTENLNQQEKARYDSETTRTRFHDKFLNSAFVRDAMRVLYSDEDNSYKKTEDILAASKALQSEENPEPVKIEDEDQELKEILHDVLAYDHYYASAVDNSSFLLSGDAFDIEQYESRLSSKIYRHLNALYDHMIEENNKQFDHEPSGGMNEQEGNKHYKELTEEQAEKEDTKQYVVASLLNFFEAQLNGRLGMDPDKPIEDSAYHIIDKTGYLKHTTVEGVFAAADVVADERVWNIERRNMPLFPHTPAANDIMQNAIGDCYYVAALASVADKDPDRIRDMMRDNGDGTVTVRFYQQATNSRMDPFYVTVDKVVSHTQSKGSLWVRTLERALAVSGLMTSIKGNGTIHPVPANINSIFDRIKDPAAFGRNAANVEKYPWLFADSLGKNPPFVPKRWEPNMDYIKGGNSYAVFKMLFGSEAETIKTSLEEKFGKNNAPQNNTDVLPVPVGNTYNNDELEIFNIIKNALAANGSVTAGTYHDPKGDSKVIIGLNQKHAYSVIGTKVVDFGNGKSNLFIKLRNPHGNKGRTYIKDAKGENLYAVNNEKLKEHANPFNDGTCYVELSHFCKEFSNVTTSHMRESKAMKEHRISMEEISVLNSYRKAIKETTERMKLSESGFWNSGAYNNIKDLATEMDEHFPESYEELGVYLQEMKTRIDAYRKHVAKKEIDVYRSGKLNACDMYENIIDAANNNFMRPEHHLMYAAINIGIHKMNDLTESVRPGDEQLREKLKEQYAKDPAGFRKAIARFPGFLGDKGSLEFDSLHDLAMRGLSLKEMDIALEHSKVVQEAKTLTVGDIRTKLQQAGGNALKQAKADLAKKLKDDENIAKQEKETELPAVGGTEVKFG